MSTATSRKLKPAIVLLVEDDPEDQTLTKRAFQKGMFRVDLQIVSDGQEAMNYLLHEGEFEDPERAPRPDLILLDLNMPNMDGREVLKRVRDHPDLRRIPVVVLTTSNQQADILRSYNLGCNSFITKPVEMGTFILALEELECYWFQLVTLPDS